MQTNRTMAAAAVLMIASVSTPHVARAQQPGIKRTDLHAVKNVGGANAAELATYVVEKGKPLVMEAK